MKPQRLSRLAIIAATVLLGGPAVAQVQEVNIYSMRQPPLIQPILDAFTKETGIKTNVIFAEKGLIERAAAEGANSPADVLLAADIGLLTSAGEQGIAQPIVSAAVNAAIPAPYRDPAGLWTGLTMRARVVYASKERVKQDAITYEDLAKPEWKGKVCSRSGQHPYNLALFAGMIAHHGEAKAKEWLAALKKNLAAKPSGGDREQAKAIFSGQCDVALGNTYYVALMAASDKQPEQKEWAGAIKVLFPNTETQGTHVNVSGVMLTKYAPHKDNALKLIEYLVSGAAQGQYAALNNEYPLRADVPLAPVVQSWGALKADKLPLGDIAKFRKRASELVDEVAFDQGPES